MNRRRELKYQIRDLVMAMGSGRTEVAELLRRLGVRAVPKDAQGCAVAVYLKAILGADPRVQSLTVEKDAVKVVTGEPPRRWSHRSNLVRVTLPDPVRQFITAFDKAIYPDLIRQESPRHAPCEKDDNEKDAEVLGEAV